LCCSVLFFGQTKESMGILHLEGLEVQKAHKKTLPLKPKVIELCLDPPAFEDPFFSDYKLDEKLEEDLGTADAALDKSVLNTPDPMKEFESEWDRNVFFGSLSSPLEPGNLFNSEENQNIVQGPPEPALEPVKLLNSDKNAVLVPPEPALNQENLFKSQDQTQIYTTTVQINEAGNITSIQEASEDLFDESWGENSFKADEAADTFNNEDMAMDYICSAFTADLSTETIKQSGKDEACGDIDECWAPEALTPICDLKVDVNLDSTLPAKATVIAENNNGNAEFKFPNMDLESHWDYASFNEQTPEIPDFPNTVWTTINNNTDPTDDILQLAINESRIYETADNGNIVPFSLSAKAAEDPKVTSASFIQPIGTISTIDNKTIPQYSSNLKPRKTKYTKKFECLGKRKVGRPERKTPREITQVPIKGSVCLTPDQLGALKHQRMRDLNNEASKRFRQNRKEKEEQNEKTCRELEDANILLKEQFLAKQAEVAAWKAKCRALGYKL